MTRMPTHPQTATWNREDRDLLIELRTEMGSTRADIAAARAEIKEINNGIAARLLNLESNSVSKIELDGMEENIAGLQEQVDSLKLWRAFLAGAWAICTVILIPVAFAYFKSS
jgi:hypothetical protein